MQGTEHSGAAAAGAHSVRARFTRLQLPVSRPSSAVCLLPGSAGARRRRAAHDAARYGGTEAAAPGVAAARRLEPHEGLEHPLQLGLRDPRALVLNDDAEFPIAAVDPYRRPPCAGGRVLQGVA